MKIIVLGTRGFPNIQGGIERHCQEIYPLLVELGCDVTVVRRKNYINSSNNSKIFSGVRFKDLWAPKSKHFETIVHTWLALFYCLVESPDIVHFHGIGPSLLVPLARIFGMKVVVTSQGADYDRKKWGSVAKFFLQLGERMSAMYSNELIVVSTEINGNFKSKYHRDDAHLIHNGASIPVKTMHTDYIESLDLVKGKYILAVARFVEEKGLDYLIDSYLNLKNKEFKLVLVGDADYETKYSMQLKNKAKEHGIIMTGVISGESLTQIYTYARLFVLPSFHEGMSLALLEALSFNLDVLVSDIPANTQLKLKEDSYFRTGSKKHLTERLEEKLSGMTIWTSFDLSEYQWDRIALKTYAIYQRL